MDRKPMIPLPEERGEDPPFSRGRAAGPYFFTSGQIGVDPNTGMVQASGVEGQTEQALRNLAGVLSAGGLSVSDVVKTTVFLTRSEDFAAMNSVYRRHFSKPFPARSTVIVAALVRAELAVEIEAIAFRRGPRST